ncbi:MAG TPA: o-succinylbenzoate synthase [Rubricoccaceae bacterium]
MTEADAAITLHPYALPLVEPVTWGGQAQTERRGILVRAETAAGAVGWGDVAPLPGFSRETLAETAETLGRASAGDVSALPFAAQFGLDLALADAAAQEAGRPLAFSADPDVTVPLAGLVLGGPAPERLAHAERLAAAGYRTVKLKVGRGDVLADAALVRDVRAAVGPDVALRLDANRVWSPADARRFADALAGVALDFVEEPLADATGLPELWLDTGLPIALDETLQHPGGIDAIRGWAAAVVVKPTLVGGIAAALAIAERARAVGVRVVISAAFESGAGLRGLVALAAATGGHAAGLDTYRWLARDVLADRLPLDRPLADVPGLLARPVRIAL